VGACWAGAAGAGSLRGGRVGEETRRMSDGRVGEERGG
jgi:hypothetical protein